MSGVRTAIPLPERFTLPALDALKAAVEEARATGDEPLLDASAVRSVDTAALQFLLVCRATQADAAARTLHDPTEPLERALRDIGAGELLA